jgi:GNAT superfamily N-acetyltransferase
MLRELRHDLDANACDAIIAGLPAWFGDPNGIRQCAEAVRAQLGLVREQDGVVDGFLTFERPYAGTAEITWMAVRADARGRGVGTELLEGLATQVARAGARLILVKTLSDREDPGPAYAATRAFYLSRGFVPVAELDIWGPRNPCQLLARPV